MLIKTKCITLLFLFLPVFLLPITICNSASSLAISVDQQCLNVQHPSPKSGSRDFTHLALTSNFGMALGLIFYILNIKNAKIAFLAIPIAYDNTYKGIEC